MITMEQKLYKTRSTIATTMYLKVFIVAIIVLLQGKFCFSMSKWVNHGGNLLNQRSARAEKKITVDTVQKLALKWKFLTNSDVTATPSIADGMIYFPSFNENLYAVNAKTGSCLWQKNLTELVGTATVSRATPVIANDLLLVNLYLPPVVIAVDRSTGALIWKSEQLDNNSYAILTMSGTFYEGFYYVGVSSGEEVLTSNCCAFQGSFQKINVSSGEVVWRTSMLPDNRGVQGGYAGAAIWGSSPSIDKKYRRIYIATGNNYQVPEYVVQCELQQANRTARQVPDPCLDPNNHAESIVALDMDTGNIVWSQHLGGYDVYSSICYKSHNPNCPPTLGDDYDFGEAPMVVHVKQGSEGEKKRKRCLVVAGQKSGIVWALDCVTGKRVWSKMAGPGSALGGAMWGMATDGKGLVFTNVVNFARERFTLLPTREVTRGGGWVALRASTGEVVWSRADPGGNYAFGPVSEANGVVFVTSFSGRGQIYALDAKSGRILWQFETGVTVFGGVSIAVGCVYVGSGYGVAPALGGVRGKYVFAFCVTPH